MSLNTFLLTKLKQRCRVAASSDKGDADLNRPGSPLLHDYKPSTGQAVQKPSGARWFAVGLGVPLLAVALILTLRGPSAHEPAESVIHLARAVPNIQLASLDFSEESAQVQQSAAIELPQGFFPPQLLPDMQYETLSLTIQRGDTLDRLFRKHDLDLGELALIARLPDTGRYIRVLKPGDELQITHNEGNLISVYRKLNLTSALLVSKAQSGFTAEIVERPVDYERHSAYGRIESSLFESASEAGLNDKVIMNLAGLFAWDIDFVYDIRGGDDYFVIYDKLYQDGEFVADGEIIAAEFNNNGDSFRAIRYTDKEGRSDYYTPEGDSVRKAFVRAPVDFTRISSSFNPRRRHPVLNTIRAHRGVDYAASKGTPIIASGDGKVIFRGRKGGYGNAVILQHGGNITTLYAHMSNFARNAPLGKRVKQGQTIGFVGSTGLATAAHLHYEYRLNGVHRNPRTVQLPQAEPIHKEYKQDFLVHAQPIIEEMNRYKRTQLASNSGN